MRIWSEPVAVIGESEDLPEKLFGNLMDRGANQQAFEDKKGNPQIDLSVWGFFLQFRPREKEK